MSRPRTLIIFDIERVSSSVDRTREIEKGTVINVLGMLSIQALFRMRADISKAETTDQEDHSHHPGHLRPRKSLIRVRYSQYRHPLS